MNEKTAAIVLLFCWASARVFGQPSPEIRPDQLRPTLEKAQKLAYENFDSALLLAGQVLASAIALDSPQVAFRTHRAIGIFNEDRNRYEAARQAYAEAMKLAEARLPLHDRLNIYNDWAIVHKKTGDFKVAREFHQRAIDEGAAAGDWEMVENGWHGLATMYSMMSDFDHSAECYFQSIAAAEKWGNRRGIVLSQQNIANIYMKAKNYPMAEKSIQIACKMAREIGDSARIATVLKIWGNIHSGQSQLDSALQKHLAALQIFEKRGNKPQQSESWLSLADIYFQLKNYPAADSALAKCQAFEAFFSPYSHAVFHQLRGRLLAAQNQPEAAAAAFLTSLEKTEKFGFKEIARENHLQLAEIRRKQGRQTEALDHALAASRLSEQIFEAEKQKTMTEARFKFDVQQRDFQIETQRKELRQSSFVRWILSGSLAVVLTLLGFVWHQVRQKQQALAQTEILLKELHHRVKNNLQTITSLMRMQVRQASDPAVLAVLNENRSRLEMIASLHQQLYRGKEVKSVNLQAFVLDLVEKLRFTYGFANSEMEIVVNIEPPVLDVDTALPLALIVNELLTNSFKYAFAETETPALQIAFSNGKLAFSDNGCGFPEAAISGEKRSFGYEMIASLARQLKSEFRVFNRNGGRFEMWRGQNGIFGHRNAPSSSRS